MRAKRWVAVLTALTLCAGLCGAASAAAAAGTADLAVVSFDWGGSTEVKPGTALTFSVTVKNKGTAATGAPITVTFGTAKQTFRQVTHSGSIAAGETVVIRSQPWTAVKGDYMVAVSVNGNRTVTESSYADNTAQANLRVADAKLTSAYPSTAAILKDGGLNILVFSDDFDSLDTVDVNNTAKEGYKWYVDRPYGASTLTSADYTVKNGVMTVHNLLPTYNYGLSTVDCVSHVGFTFNTGYLEVRLRIPRPRANTADEKGIPAIWALPPEKLYGSDNHWVELDWMEYWGDNDYTVCLHEQVYENGIVQHSKNSNAYHGGLGDGEWHVMGWLWQKGVFITYFDGVEVMRLTYAEGEFSDPLQETIKGDIQQGVFVHMDEQQMPIFIGGSKDNPMELDYVRVWDGNDDYVPPVAVEETMDADTFWRAYAADEQGNAIVTVTADNYARVLAGEADWNRLPAATQSELALRMMGQGQPVYVQLLAQAKTVSANPEAYTTAASQPTTTAKPVTTTAVTVRPTGPDTTATAPSAENTPTAAGSSTVAGSTTAGDGTQTTAPSAAAGTAAPQDTDGGVPGWVWAAILGVVAVLVGATVVFFVCRKREQPQPASGQSTGADEASGSESGAESGNGEDTGRDESDASADGNGEDE